MSSSSAVLIKGFTITPSQSGVEAGIYTINSGICTIRDNVIADFPQYGIRMYYGVRIEIFNNTIRNNNIYGISLEYSYFNTIFHNNILNNTNQLRLVDSPDNFWDNGCEGNYWSDYNGADLSNPPDGIGDTLLPHQGVDFYPLMNRYWNPCDINHDLSVNTQDLKIAATAYGSSPWEPRWNPHADITGPMPLVPDNLIDIKDTFLICKDYGETYP